MEFDLLDAALKSYMNWHLTDNTVIPASYGSRGSLVQASRFLTVYDGLRNPAPSWPASVSWYIVPRRCQVGRQQPSTVSAFSRWDELFFYFASNNVQ